MATRSIRYRSQEGTILERAVHSWPTEEDMVSSGEYPYSLPPPQSLDDLGFEPKPMVGWFRPSELIKTGIETLSSIYISSWIDKRESMSTLTTNEFHDYSVQLHQQGELWIDYVADLGDGWDSTYTIARLLAEKNLYFTQDGQCTTDPEAPIATQRGHILVMGGDQVYPTPSLEEYENRMVQPYRCALPLVPYAPLAPHLYLIPGNHDWYDGLNSFFKRFCYGKWVGGWKTQQRRSYFALKLDKKLWLWGIDIQLNSDIDQPQLNYFRHLADEVMEEQSKIILCTAEPSWVFVEAKTKEEKDAAKRERKKEEIYGNLGHLEQMTLGARRKHEVLVGLAGDWHNYTRYASENGDGHLRFVSGGGGAYLYPTHNMPKVLKLPKLYSKDRDAGDTYERKAIFPSEAESRLVVNSKSRINSFFRPNWEFNFFLGAYYMILAWIVQSASKMNSGSGNTLLDQFEVSFAIASFIAVILHSPVSVVFLVILVGALIVFTDSKRWGKKVILGGLHGLAHVALFLWLIYFIARINLGVLGLRVDNVVQVVLFGVEMLVIGGFLGGFLFGFYLFFSNLFFKIHDNEVLLVQSIPDYKHFLRFHLTRDGQITIYPVGVKRVNRQRSWKLDKTERTLAAWTLNRNAKDGQPWFEPNKGDIQDFAELIEEPISIRPART